MPLNYPFTTFNDSVQGVISSANDLYEVINGDDQSTVTVDQGDPIKTLRATLKYIEDLGSSQFEVIFSDQNIVADAFRTYLMDMSTVALNFTLPANATEGQYALVLDYLGNSSVNNIIVNTTDGSLIDGNPTYPIAVDSALVAFYKTATDWVSHIEVASITLPQIQAKFIEAFDSLADVINSPSLAVGRRVQTLGKTVLGDGGTNIYEIVAAGTGTPDNERFFDLVGITGQAKLIEDRNRYSQSILLFDKNIIEDFTIPSDQNALSVSPTVNPGITVTVESGASWVIV